MARFEESHREKENSSEETENFHLDASMLEIQAQLESDAKHLSELYPPMRSNQLKQLVERCQEKVRNCEEPVSQPASASEKSPRRKVAWTQYAMSLCLGFVLVFSVTLLWKNPELNTNANPALSQNDESLALDKSDTQAIEMPAEFLNASQPELEAMYDEVGLVYVAVEF